MKQFLSFFAILLIHVSISADDHKGPERFEGSIAEFEERDREAASKPGAILFVGSSSIRLWDLGASWSDRATVNNGFGGSTIGDSLHYFDRLFLPHSPSAIVLYAGDNDIANELTPEQVSDDFRSLAALLKATRPGVPVLYIAIKPSQKRWDMWPDMKKANDLIAAQCAASPDLHFVDIAAPMLDGVEGAPDSKWFAEDGLHLSEWGYEQWTAAVNAALAKAKK